MNPRVPPPAVIANQHAASDPAVSAWVSANAGAGKTHVLAQRVIRLLLERSTDPSKILCLTFTKAAAANMANRIFDTLRKWIALDDAGLDAAIRETGAKLAGASQRDRARRLFAAALETPGGLKVQTIHGFCTRLLQQFPFEANVPARFRVLEEVEQKQLLEQLRRTMLFEASSNPDSPTGRALSAIIPAASDFGFSEGLLEAIRERERLLAWVDDAGGLQEAAAQLSAVLGIKPSDTLEAIETEILDGPHLPSRNWMSVEGICRSGTANDQRQARRLQAAVAATGRTRVETYLEIFYTDKGEQRGSIVTASLVKQYPDLDRLLTSEKARLPALCEQRKAAMIRDRTMALMTLAIEVIERYRDEKNRRGLLDYDDLIARTRDLLGNVDAAWVHYKLDLGIDHLLIDEAQDTSPEQWDIIKRFVAEFTAGAGARSQAKRTIFAVGDDKQSIFSFQGAKPLEFDEARKFFEQAHKAAELDFHPIKSIHSFRSVPVVLEAVDKVFEQPAAHKGLTADPVATVHQAVRDASPGLVELWPIVKPDDKPEVEPWDQPFDTTSETSPRVKLARQIAAAVKAWLARGDLVGDGNERHPLRAGDILVLVRQRGPLFEAIIRALKSADVAVAGADRLQLTEHIAIMDLLALADALLHPQDDLALATILKSPLFGISEEELFELARNNKRSLRVTLRTVQPELAAKLDALDAESQRLSPFAFYARLLGGGARKEFLARLGAEANDALDEFLNLALAYESRQTPSLQGFVHWIRTASTEVKRDMEIARNEVRVMTVHGAKGLEAAVVVLADTTTEPAGPQIHHPKLFSLPAQGAAPGTPDRIAWMPTKQQDTAVVSNARAAMIFDNENEYRRLLYVAMTRAADRLIVCGSVGRNNMPPGCWYQLIEQGLEATGNLIDEPGDVKDSSVRRYRKFVPETGAVPTPDVARGDPLPDWLTNPVTAEAARAQPLRPSSAFDGDVPARSGQAADRRRAMARGTHVHRLMQSMPDVPPPHRAEAARRYLARQRDLDDTERSEIAAHALRLMNDLRFDALFLPGSRAEISIVGRIGNRPVSGQVDRLVVTPDEVLIADYKTNRPAPNSLDDAERRHPGYVTQLALYRAVLMRLYPGRPVRAALLWTETPELMEIPAADLDAALLSSPPRENP
jgi:ATP-dependent helicase/nuclease subunit A